MTENEAGGPPTHLSLVEGEESAAALAARLVAASAWFDLTPMPDGSYAFRVRPEATIVALVERHLAGDRSSAAGTTLPKEVADRLHRWGDRDDLYADFVERFLTVYDQDGFEFGERDFYDPETGKTYRTQLTLEIDEVEPPDDDTCPECGGDLADATDIPNDAICEACGWSRSGVRRCIRCGGREHLVPDDAVCAKCRR
jgi:hypothetical protein